MYNARQSLKFWRGCNYFTTNSQISQCKRDAYIFILYSLGHDCAGSLENSKIIIKKGASQPYNPAAWFLSLVVELAAGLSDVDRNGGRKGQALVRASQAICFSFASVDGGSRAKSKRSLKHGARKNLSGQNKSC
jgi:hypothetical protein